MKTASFANLVYDNKKKKTKRQKFLEEMDQVIPWEALSKIIEKYYPKAGNGRHPFRLLTMLRIYFMQQWYALSDPAMEDALYESESMRRFARIDFDGVVPDETTILNFRHLLEKHRLTKQIFESTKRYLTERGLLLREGTIVDATIINAPSSTKNQEKSRDKEMKQTKKGNQWYFGMKAHIGTDTGRGLVHSVVVTSAAVHDSRVMDQLLHGEERAIYGDKAYTNEKKKQKYESDGVAWCVKRKAGIGRQLTQEAKDFNQKHGPIRAKVEHVFLVVKHLWNYRKVRYKGLFKNEVQVYSLFSLANLYLVRNKLQTL
jgi:IS5 family transposase